MAIFNRNEAEVMGRLGKIAAGTEKQIQKRIVSRCPQVSFDVANSQFIFVGFFSCSLVGMVMLVGYLINGELLMSQIPIAAASYNQPPFLLSVGADFNISPIKANLY